MLEASDSLATPAIRRARSFKPRDVALGAGVALAYVAAATIGFGFAVVAEQIVRVAVFVAGAVLVSHVISSTSLAS